jgi:hypothetical protein
MDLYKDDKHFMEQMKSFEIPDIPKNARTDPVDFIKFLSILDNEMKPITDFEISEQKRMITLYKNHLESAKNAGHSNSTLEKITIHMTKAIYILCNMEVKQERQRKVGTLLDKLVF